MFSVLRATILTHDSPHFGVCEWSESLLSKSGWVGRWQYVSAVPHVDDDVLFTSDALTCKVPAVCEYHDLVPRKNQEGLCKISLHSVWAFLVGIFYI